VQKMATTVALVVDNLLKLPQHLGEGTNQADRTHQNCHSGSLRTNGRNSSSRDEGSGVGTSPPSSISSAMMSSWIDGSNFG
jgi:hypothetical protein